MTDFASDTACATLTLLEEGVLRGLASLGSDTSVADLAEFCAGYCRSRFTDRDVRHALFALDALGWAEPDTYPLDQAATWTLTPQGEQALTEAAPRRPNEPHPSHHFVSLGEEGVRCDQCDVTRGGLAAPRPCPGATP